MRTSMHKRVFSPEVGDLRDAGTLVRAAKAPDKGWGWLEAIDPYANVFCRAERGKFRLRSDGEDDTPQKEATHKFTIRVNELWTPQENDWFIFSGNKFIAAGIYQVLGVETLDSMVYYQTLHTIYVGKFSDRVVDNVDTVENPNAEENPEPEPEPADPNHPLWM